MGCLIRNHGLWQWHRKLQCARRARLGFCKKIQHTTSSSGGAPRYRRERISNKTGVADGRTKRNISDCEALVGRKISLSQVESYSLDNFYHRRYRTWTDCS